MGFEARSFAPGLTFLPLDYGTKIIYFFFIVDLPSFIDVPLLVSFFSCKRFKFPHFITGCSLKYRIASNWEVGEKSRNLLFVEVLEVALAA